MLSNVWKAHDSNPWQNNFINRIQVHNQSPWFKPMVIYLSKSSILLAIFKTQFSLTTSKSNFSLATSKPNSHWQYQQLNVHWQHQKPKSPLAVSKAHFFIGTILSKEPKIYWTPSKENISWYNRCLNIAMTIVL